MLPWGCLASANLRHQRRGGRAHGFAYKAALQAIHLHALNQIRGERPRFPHGAVEVHYVVVPPDARRRDCQNLFKATEDALNNVAWTDDSQICRGSWRRLAPDRANPRLEVEITGDAVA